MEAVLDNCINNPVTDTTVSWETVPLDNLSSPKTQISPGNVPFGKKDTQAKSVPTENIFPTEEIGFKEDIDGDSTIHKIRLTSANSSKIQVPQGILEVPVNTTCSFCVEEKTGNVPLLPKIYSVRRNSFFLNPYAHFVLLFFLTLSISQLGCSKPVLRSPYDGRNVTKMELYALTKGKFGSQFHLKDVTLLFIKVHKYSEIITILGLFQLSTVKVILHLDENFFGSDKKQIYIVLNTSSEISLNAIRYKNAPFGRLKKYSQRI